MKKRQICGILAMAMVAMLAGCGNVVVDDRLDDAVVTLEGMGQGFGSDASAGEESDSRAEEDSDVSAAMELQYNNGTLTEEEQTAVMDELKVLCNNMSVENYVGEAIHMMSTQEWFDLMTVGLETGSRTYSYQRKGETILSLDVGYQSEKKPYANAVYQGKAGKIVEISFVQTEFSVMISGCSDGEYEGSFEYVKIDGSKGTIEREKGTYSKGTIVGELVTSSYDGPEGEIFDLWNNRDNFKYESKTQYFDENGVAITKPVATAKPTTKPTAKPTAAPTAKPTAAPTNKPSGGSSSTPTATAKPTAAPTAKPTAKPVATAAPTAKPTAAPTARPTAAPTPAPTAAPPTPAPPTPAPPTPAPPTQAPAPTPEQGDNDVDWTPDFD